MYTKVCFVSLFITATMHAETTEQLLHTLYQQLTVLDQRLPQELDLEAQRKQSFQNLIAFLDTAKFPELLSPITPQKELGQFIVLSKNLLIFYEATVKAAASSSLYLEACATDCMAVWSKFSETFSITSPKDFFYLLHMVRLTITEANKTICAPLYATLITFTNLRTNEPQHVLSSCKRMIAIVKKQLAWPQLWPIAGKDTPRFIESSESPLSDQWENPCGEDIIAAELALWNSLIQDERNFLYQTPMYGTIIAKTVAFMRSYDRGSDAHINLWRQWLTRDFDIDQLRLNRVNFNFMVSGTKNTLTDAYILSSQATTVTRTSLLRDGLARLISQHCSDSNTVLTTCKHPVIYKIQDMRASYTLKVAGFLKRPDEPKLDKPKQIVSDADLKQRIGTIYFNLKDRQELALASSLYCAYYSDLTDVEQNEGAELLRSFLIPFLGAHNATLKQLKQLDPPGNITELYRQDFPQPSNPKHPGFPQGVLLLIQLFEQFIAKSSARKTPELTVEFINNFYENAHDTLKEDQRKQKLAQSKKR